MVSLVSPADIELGLSQRDKNIESIESQREVEPDARLLQHFDDKSSVQRLGSNTQSLVGQRDAEVSHQLLLNNTEITRSILKNPSNLNQKREDTSSFVTIMSPSSGKIISRDGFTPIRMRQGKIAEDTIRVKDKNRQSKNIRTSLN